VSWCSFRAEGEGNEQSKTRLATTANVPKPAGQRDNHRKPRSNWEKEQTVARDRDGTTSGQWDRAWHWRSESKEDPSVTERIVSGSLGLLKKIPFFVIKAAVTGLMAASDGPGLDLQIR
jgi:hypothetical protein